MGLRIAPDLKRPGRIAGPVGGSLLAAVLSLAGCQPTTPQVVTVDGALLRVDWTAAELAQDPSIRTLKVTPQASWHLLRLAAAEAPHVHDGNDLTVTVLAGHGTLHLADRAVRLKPGDVILIPRKTIHWMEPYGGPDTVLLVVTPPLGKNFRRVVAVPRP